MYRLWFAKIGDVKNLPLPAPLVIILLLSLDPSAGSTRESTPLVLMLYSVGDSLSCMPVFVLARTVGEWNL